MISCCGALVAFLGAMATQTMAPLVAPAVGVGASSSTNTAIQPLAFGSSSPVLMPRMRQSVTMGYATNGSSSASGSLYTNEMSWRLSGPLTLHLDLGVAAPLWASGPGSEALREQTPVLLPAVGLEWHPTDNAAVTLLVSRSPYASSWTDPWGSTLSGYRVP